MSEKPNKSKTLLTHKRGPKKPNTSFDNKDLDNKISADVPVNIEAKQKGSSVRVSQDMRDKLRTMVKIKGFKSIEELLQYFVEEEHSRMSDEQKLFFDMSVKLTNK